MMMTAMATGQRGTDTGIYINGQDTGTDPLDPDTDDDGICDGPNAVPPICIAGMTHHQMVTHRHQLWLH